MPLWAAALLEVALIAASGLLWRRSGPLSAVAWLCAVAVVAVPWLLPFDLRFWRAFLAVFSLIPVFKLVEMSVDPVDRSARFRVWQVLSIFDARKVVAMRPRFDLNIGVRILIQVAVLALGLLVVRGAASAPGVAGLALRWAGGILVVSGMVQSIAASVRLAYAAVGLRVPVLFDWPLTAASVTEFWGRRWNRTVGGWMRRHCFDPAARRGRARMGILLAFTVSAAFHAALVAPALGARGSLLMIGFFTLQAPIVWVDRVLRERPLLRRGWLYVAMGATAPLFVEPFLEVLGL